MLINRCPFTLQKIWIRHNCFLFALRYQHKHSHVRDTSRQELCGSPGRCPSLQDRLRDLLQPPSRLQAPSICSSPVPQLQGQANRTLESWCAMERESRGRCAGKAPEGRKHLERDLSILAKVSPLLQGTCGTHYIKTWSSLQLWKKTAVFTDNCVLLAWILVQKSNTKVCELLTEVQKSQKHQ